MFTEYPKQQEIGQAFIKSIMQDYEDIPESNGMRVLRDVESLEVMDKTDVVVRSITEDFWQSVIDATAEYRVCAVGTPGIGKTTTTCILIRLLLQQGKKVVYRVLGNENDGYVYMFIPPSNTGTSSDVNVNVIEEIDFKYWHAEVNSEDVYYVVDPGKTKKRSCDLNSNYVGKVIIVASPDEGHWGWGEFIKIRRKVKGTFLYFPVWSVDELLSSRDFFDINMDETVIYNRYEEVGGIPRFIFATQEDYDAVLRSQERAINCLTDKQIQLLALNDAYAAHTFGENQPQSIIMVYKYCGMNFKKFSVEVSSHRVMQLLVTNKMTIFWNLILSGDGIFGNAAWQVFEVYCKNLMLGGVSKNFYDHKYHNGTEWWMDLTSTLQLGGCSKIKGTRQSIIAAAKGKENEDIVFYSMNPTNKFMDFVYRKKNTIYAFQVTLQKGHSCCPKAFAEVLQEVGNDYHFLLHYLTLKNTFASFQLSPNNPFEIESSIPPKTNGDWTLKLICVPGPSEDQSVFTTLERFSSLKVNQLRALLKIRNIQMSKTLKKNDLIKLLVSAMSTTSDHSDNDATSTQQI